MAARLSPRQDAATREKIQTTQLVKRLNAFALGELDDQTGQPIELSRERLRAIEILLRKTVPDLQSVTISGDEENPLRASMVVTFRKPSHAPSDT